MNLTNWLQRIFSRSTSTRIRGARTATRRRKWALAHSQHWLEYLEARTLLSADFGFAFQLGGTDNDDSQSVATDAVGNVYITGSFKGTVDFDPGTGVTSVTSTGGSAEDLYVAKYDTSGALVWVRTVDSTDDDDLGLDIAVDAAGNV